MHGSGVGEGGPDMSTRALDGSFTYGGRWRTILPPDSSTDASNHDERAGERCGFQVSWQFTAAIAFGK